MSYFSIMLKPMEDESLPGYVLRLAKRNGIACLTELMSHHQLSHICRGNGVLFEKTLKEYALTEFINPLRKSRGETDLSTCKICPVCVLSSMPVLESWQKPTSYHCEVHQVVLVENCPHCSSSLKWEIPILRAQCTNDDCGALLPAQTSPLVTLSPSAIAECYAATLFACQIQPHYGSLSSIVRLELGYEVLTQSKTYLPLLSEYLRQKADYTMYPATFRFWEMIYCVNSLSSEWPLTKMLVETLSIVESSDTDSTHSTTDLYAPRRVLTDYLSILTTASDYPEFVKLYTRKKAVLIDGVRSEHFSIAPLIQTLKSRSAPNQENAINLGSWLSIIAPFQIETSQIVKACCDGKLRYSFNGALKLMDAVLILEIDMRNFILNHLENNGPNYVSSEVATRLCNQPIELIQQAKQVGLLRTYRVNNFTSRQFLKRDVLALARILNNQLSLPISEHTTLGRKYNGQVQEI